VFPKYFTPKEATKRLPLVKKIVGDILAKVHRMRRLAEEYDNEELPVEYYDLEADISVHMRELENLGCFYKDWNFEIGLVDFPAIVNNEEVFLCWRSDEENLRWYHGIEEGYAGRRLIPQELLG